VPVEGSLQYSSNWQSWAEEQGSLMPLPTNPPGMLVMLPPVTVPTTLASVASPPSGSSLKIWQEGSQWLPHGPASENEIVGGTGPW
jgi:hypothetical protein